MRTLVFVERFWPLIGGVEIITAELVSRLAEHGHELLVVTDREHPSLLEHDRFGDVPIRRMPIVRPIHNRDIEGIALARAAMGEIVSDFRPDLLHAIFTGAGVWLLPRRLRAPLIVAFHGSWPTIDFGAAGGVFASTLDRAAWITACSQDALGTLLATAPGIRGRCSVILNGLDARFQGVPGEPPDGPPLLYCSGRIVRDKGIDIAIKALGQVVRIHPDVRLIVAGDGPALPDLVAQAASLGLSHHVQFTGWIAPEQTHALVQRASVVLIPSRLEGFGLVAIEAGLGERPVVASRVGGLPEVVVDGVTGLLVAPDDPAAMADAVLRLLGKPAAARRLGLAARERALTLFSAQRHAEEWDALYRQVVRLGKGGAGGWGNSVSAEPWNRDREGDRR